MPVCVPKANGVPYLGGPPRFWTTTATSPASFDTQIEDPRWTGAYAFGYGDGAGPLALLRVVWTDDGGEAILLSWHCRVDPLSDKEDQLWVGIQTAHGELFIKIEWDSTGTVISSPQTSASAVTVWKASVHGRTGSGTVDPSVPLTGATPAWILENTRVWRSVVGVPPNLNYPWAVHMRIPIKPTATSITDGGGVAINKASFRMWVYGEQWFFPDTAGNPQKVVPFQWPAVYSAGALQAPYDTAGNFRPPPNDDWSALSCSASCDGAGGIAISPGNFGARNTSGGTYAIRRNANNTFFAKPINQSTTSAPAGAIGASFRLANWGSTVGSGGTWAALAVTGSPTNRGTLATGGAPPSDTADIEVQWDSSAWEADFVSGARTTHQCMAVDLDVRSGGFPLSRASAVQNMDFVTNSVQIREAEINVKGARVPVDRAYLFLQMEGMTEGYYNWGAAIEKAVGANPDDKDLAAAAAQLKEIFGQYAEKSEGLVEQIAGAVAGLDAALVERLLPHIKAHVYYPTGQRIVRGGRKHDVYSPAVSFGLFGLAAATEGWRSVFDKAVRVTDNLYAVAIGRVFQRARVPTKLQGLHKDEKPLRPPRIRPVEFKRFDDPLPIQDILGVIVDQVDLLDRVRRRVSERLAVLDEIGRRARGLAGRFGKVRWAAEANELLTQIAEHSRAAGRTAYGLTRDLQTTAALEQRLTVLDAYLDTLAMFKPDEIDEVVAKALQGREGAFSELVELEQQAHMAACLLPPIVAPQVEHLRSIESLLGKLDDAAGLLRRLERDFDRRSPFDLDIDIEPIRDLARLPFERFPLGALGTLRRVIGPLAEVPGVFKALRAHLDALESGHVELSEIADELSAIDEALVRKHTARLRKLRGSV